MLFIPAIPGTDKPQQERDYEPQTDVPMPRMYRCPRGPITKKNKPYITCDPCGVQLFVRGPAGIDAFNRLVDRPGAPGLWARLQEMEERYYLKCQKCGSRFWIEPNLVKTSMFDGSLQGFRCPQKSCAATVRWDNKQ